MRLPGLPSVLLPLLSLLLLPTTTAAADTLRTTAAAYCSPASSILVQDFAVTYFKANRSLVFAFTLNSTDTNTNVNANIFVNAYGMNLVNQTIDLCQLIGGALCPLPQLNLSAYGTYQLPESLTSQIPDIAWSVPDLEAWARLTLRRPNGTEALCIQGVLSNGLTTEHLAVKIATGVFTAVAVIVGLIHGAANTASPAQYRWFDILFLFQTAVATGFMNINYPEAYRSFTKNFAWSYALFRSERMQNTINDMRYRTGGYLNGTLSSGVTLIDRSQSPYNNYVDINDVIERVQALANALSGLGFGGIFRREIQNEAYGLARRQYQAESANVTSIVANVGSTSDTTGISVYARNAGIPYPNLMTTIFFFFLAFLGIFLVVHAIIYLIARIGGRSIWAQDLRRKFWLWMAGNALLVCLGWSLPVWIFAFFQFRIGDSGLAIFWGVFSIILTFIPLATIFVLSLLRARRRSSTSPTISPLYTSYNWFHSAGALYRAYRPRFHWFWFVFPLAIIARSGFIVFGWNNVWAQVIGNVVVEFIILVLLFALRPHKDRKGDWLAPFLSFCRLAAFGLLIAFIPSVGVAAIPRTIIGFVIIVMFGIPTILLFLGLLFNLGYGWLWRRHDDRIEDGFEVDRFVARDDTSSQRAAMTQVNAPFSARHSESRNNSGNTLDRRTSLMEPVGDNVYEPHNRNSHLSGYYNEPVANTAAYGNGSGYANRSGPTSPVASTYNNRWSQHEDSQAAYAQAAQGGRLSNPPSRAPSRASRAATPISPVSPTVGNGHGGFAGVGSGTPTRGLDGRTSRPLSSSGSRASGQTQYFTPMEDERRWSRDQYFGNGNQGR